MKLVDAITAIACTCIILGVTLWVTEVMRENWQVEVAASCRAAKEVVRSCEYTHDVKYEGKSYRCFEVDEWGKRNNY